MLVHHGRDGSASYQDHLPERPAAGAAIPRTMIPLLSHPRTRLNVLGTVVLLIGLVSGSLLYRSSLQDDAQTDEDVLAMQDQSKAYDQAVQRNVGATGLLMAHGTQTLEKLTRPRPLAIVLVTISGVAAGGFFLAASRRRG